MSDFLFARPSFWEGLGRLIDFGGTLTEFNGALSGPQADRYAIGQDWRAVGDDLRNAMGVYEVTIEVEEPVNADRP